MAKRTASRQELRKQVEAAEAIEKAGGKKATKKKATKKKAKRKTAKAKVAVRNRLIWGVFSGNMKEEARFPYEQREEADKKIESLRARATKKLYFIQPIKEPIPDAPAEVVEEDAEKK